jgi:hypothetical protein
VLGLKPARGYSPRDVAACHTRPAEKLNGPRPGGPVQPGKRLAAQQRGVGAGRASPHVRLVCMTARWRTRWQHCGGWPVAMCSQQALMWPRGGAGQGGGRRGSPERRVHGVVRQRWLDGDVGGGGGAPGVIDGG